MEIRRLRTPEEYREAERLQKAVWRFPDREVNPLSELVAIQRNGGIALGAFERGKLVGLCFGCPGFRNGKVYHYSRMLGVLPGYQDSGIGARLKRRQRRESLAQGLDLVKWAFDPLQTRNGRFNLEKLGVVVREYVVNLYPGSESRYNRSIGSDRFIAEWWIASRRVRERLAGRGKTKPARGGISVEVPDDIEALKRKSPAAARRWRLKTRKAFLRLFRQGYVVHGFARRRGRCTYLLEKGFRVR